MPPSDRVVHKFGGTSVANADRYRHLARVMLAEPGARKAVVVSAMAGVTDALLQLVDLARKRDAAYRERLDAVREKHLAAARDLLPADGAAGFEGSFAADLRDIADVLRAVWLGRSASELTAELVAGYGEVWSARLLHAHLAALGLDARCLDARDVLVVEPAELGPAVVWDVSERNVRAFLAAGDPDWLVVTGYVASTRDGVPTTLKRNGSDFSGSIFGALLNASSITIWTDVDGVLSADPRRVPEAVVLDAVSYSEAWELAYFGAKVLHPRTMEPAVARGIPIFIRNTFNPTHPGTAIRAREAAAPGRPVRGFTTFDGIALVNVEGSGMIGVPGVASRIFGALRAAGVSVVLISQASSEHSVCFAVPEASADLARRTVEQAFEKELAAGQIHAVTSAGGCSVLAAVGDGMAQVPGVAARFFGALARAGVSVRAIAQGSSERNISAVIDRRDSTRALRAVHAGFYLSDRVISVGVVGVGLVGAALLAQLRAQAPVLRAKHGVDLRVRAVADSKRMLLADAGVPLDGPRETLAALGEPLDLTRFTEHVRAEHLPHAVIVDCTASEAVASRYVAWLREGVHVVTPNKRAGAGDLERYQTLRALGRTVHRHWLYEATVGAGLPVITTLRDLTETGDAVLRVEGVLSGTLSYVFNRLDASRPFSTVVREAKALGYTEPDPRDDLSGTDVARKLVILARELGLALELGDVAVESLVPASAADAEGAEGFLDALRAHDDAMEARRAAAEARGRCLRYVGVVEAEGKARVSLEEYPVEHAFARLSATDNVIAFTTSRYRTQPLVVQGPGAGPEVTAGGVFADLLRLAAWAGASAG
ncbi:MAG: bifunctional aspartate kinase/homoserine dehydrogenase I [Polyangiales bacterium]